MIIAERRATARWVGDDVLAVARARPATGEVTARFGSMFYAQIGDYVIAVLPPGAPRMPNGVATGAALPGADMPEVGEPVSLTPSRLGTGRFTVDWDAASPPRWDSRVLPWTVEERRGLRARACAILGTPLERASPELATDRLARIGGFAARDPGARAGLDALIKAVRSGDPDDAACAGRALSGRGAGLTPIGDDVLAAAALTVVSAGAGMDSAPERRSAWLKALAPPDLRTRTTSLSATLLELAVRGHGIGPARELLRPGPLRERQLRSELASLRRLGHTTGAAYVAAIGAVALLLGWDETTTTNKEMR